MSTGFVAGLFLLAVTPLFAADVGRPFLLVFLQLPIYMLHQLEEHAGDRFRRYLNETMAGGREALTTPAVVLINVGGVWGVDLAAIYLARFAALGFGLIAVYLTLVNAIVHIVSALGQRRYNPGLATAIVLFLPVGIAALVSVSGQTGVTATQHGIGLGIAILIHVAIAVHVKRRAAQLATA
ncbi:HXXEE domain-containing protein [Amorphus sp. 3PC139-8]